MTTIRDELIRAGVAAAIPKTRDRAVTSGVYPGHFTVTVDGRTFGTDSTWPGLGQQHEWLWCERYLAQPDGGVLLSGSGGYCEYAAILVRVVLGNPARFLIE